MTWEQAWQESRTGWDAGAPAPALVEYLLSRGDEGDEQATRRALVPGCGSGYDAFALAQQGYHTTGIDLAPTAARRFEALREERGLSKTQAHIIVRDFFELSHEPAHQHAYDLIWDYTFLCAIEPEQREGWGKAMSRLVRPGGLLLTLLFPIRDVEDPSPPKADEPGPPFRLHIDHAHRVLDDAFSLEQARVPGSSHPGREGLELLAIWRRLPPTQQESR